MKNIGVILAGGVGARFESNVPKQYMKLNGNEVIAYAINAFKSCRSMDDFILVVDEGEYASKNIEQKYNVKCVLGGNIRNESVYNAIAYIKENYPNCQKVLFHDAARPFITPDILTDFYDELNSHDGVITTVKITDSLGSENQWIVDRKGYFLIQTPEAFQFKLLEQSFIAQSNLTAIVQQLPENSKVKHYYGFKNNLKITYPEDLFLAEQLIKLSFYRKSDINYHNLPSLGRVLVLGGSGGIGTQLLSIFKENHVDFFAPSSKELNLNTINVEKLTEVLNGFEPDVIINLAATSKSDSDGIIENFDLVFNVNLKASLILIEYALQLNKRMNIVLLSSSSSTKGRENITLYSASKAGLNSIIESLSTKMAAKDVYINGIVPEKINTPLINKLHKKEINVNEMLDVEDVIDAILYYAHTNEFGHLVHIRKGL